MLSPARVWIALVVLYAVFFGWYTSFGGPLTPEEIERYMGIMAERSEDPARLEVWRAFMESDTGDDFVMYNAIDLRETPRAGEGVAPGETSAEVISRYTAPFMRAAVQRASHPIFYGWAAAGAVDLWGIEGAEDWTNAGLVRYRSRRDLMKQVEFISQLDTNIHDFKIAALEKTIAFPVDPWFHLGDPRLVLGLVFAVIGLAWHLRCARRAA